MLKDKKLFLFDIDGTIAVENNLFDGTKDLLEHIDRINGKSCFITNNSTKSRADYVSKFKKWGLNYSEDNFVTASYASSLFLKKNYGRDKIFVVGTKSFLEELEAFELNVTEKIEEDISCVIIGYDNELRYDKLADACEILSTKKVDYYATNPDLRCPAAFGFVPDCGAICEMIFCTVERKPIYLGKPNPELVNLCIEASGFTKNETLVVGDRLYTDIACGINAEVDTALVLSGEAKCCDVNDDMKFRPSFVFKNIRELANRLI